MAEQEFKPFHKTYRLLTFFMTVGFIYPNPKTEKMRVAGIALTTASSMPIAVLILIDIYLSWKERDMINIIRHSTVVGPFMAVYFKMFLMFLKRDSAKALIDEMNRDYGLYNNKQEKYKEIIRTTIKTSQLYCEKCWAATVIICVMIFPGMAIFLNGYNFLFKSEPTKYMIHDLRKPFSEPEERFNSPYFEIMFVYMIYSSILYVVGFVGCDGFFGLAINHACMKMDIYCEELVDAFRCKEAMKDKVALVIREQCRMYSFVDLIQDTFNNWLGLILIATMIQIGTCMYHIIESNSFDVRYTIFLTGAVLHIYLPCRYAAKLKATGSETATRFYCSGWEGVQDLSVRKTLVFMMARAQVNSDITAFNIKAFNMDLFVSVLQTAYSMFTLLRT